MSGFVPLPPGFAAIPPRSAMREAPLTGEAPPSYDIWFDRWAGEVVAWFNDRHAGLPPFELSSFNGCSGVPDICRHCCLVHDIRYHVRDDRAAADAELRDCIAAVAQVERHPWKWYWFFVAWRRWLGVRLLGGRAWRR